MSNAFYFFLQHLHRPCSSSITHQLWHIQSNCFPLPPFLVRLYIHIYIYIHSLSLLCTQGPPFRTPFRPPTLPLRCHTIINMPEASTRPTINWPPPIIWLRRLLRLWPESRWKVNIRWLVFFISARRCGIELLCVCLCLCCVCVECRVEIVGLAKINDSDVGFTEARSTKTLLWFGEYLTNPMVIENAESDLISIPNLLWFICFY